jgi:hypothetical protein
MTRTSKPATGHCRWLAPQRNGNPTLSITPTGGEEQVYELEERPDGYRLHCLTHLIETGQFKYYTLTRHHHTLLCDCPDATQRRSYPGACKHARATVAALRKTF